MSLIIYLLILLLLMKKMRFYYFVLDIWLFGYENEGIYCLDGFGFSKRIVDFIYESYFFVDYMV